MATPPNGKIGVRIVPERSNVQSTKESRAFPTLGNDWSPAGSLDLAADEDVPHSNHPFSIGARPGRMGSDFLLS